MSDIQIISSTNRPGNLSALVARYYSRLLRAAGSASRMMNLEELPADLLFSDLYGRRSEAFQPFQEQVSRSDKFLFIVPEYNGSIPGVLKSFIDACKWPDSFRGKKAGMVGISAGRGGNEKGLDHLYDILDYLQMEVLPQRVHIARVREEVNREGDLLKEKTIDLLKAQAQHLIKF